MNSNIEEPKADQKTVGRFKQIRATMCKHCPICNHARKNPDSITGKILHHRFHSQNCPMWTAYEEIYGEDQK